jgi:hypothetical protein
MLRKVMREVNHVLQFEAPIVNVHTYQRIHDVVHPSPVFDVLEGIPVLTILVELWTYDDQPSLEVMSPAGELVFFVEYS